MKISSTFNNYYYPGGYEVLETQFEHNYYKDILEDGTTRIRLLLNLLLPDGNKIICKDMHIDGLALSQVKSSSFDFSQLSYKQSSVLPKNLFSQSPKVVSVDLDEFYEDLVSAYQTQQKGGRNLINQQIEELVNKYGMITTGPLEMFLNDGIKSDSKDGPNVFQVQNVLGFYPEQSQRKSLITLDSDFHYKEWHGWAFLFSSLIPSKLDYVSKDKYSINPSQLNKYVSDIRVAFKDENLESWDYVPYSLISALIFHSKTKKTKKPPRVLCSNCKTNERIQSIGRGRPSDYCSNACKQEAYRKRKGKN